MRERAHPHPCGRQQEGAPLQRLLLLLPTVAEPCLCMQFSIGEYRDKLYLDILKRKKADRRKIRGTPSSQSRSRNGEGRLTPERSRMRA